MISEHGPHIGLAFYDGRQTAAERGSRCNAQPAGKWTANSKLTGMSYVAVTFTYKKGAPVFEGGIPKLTFGLRGAAFVRLAQAGHDWANPATWEFSENPAVAIFNYMRGFYKAGELVMGMGIPAQDIIIDSFTAAANICDEPVDLDGGGSEARYRICTFLSADASVTHAQTLEVLLSTMAGYLYDYGGSYYLQAGAAYTSVATITDNDLVTGLPVTFIAKRTRAELINRIHGQFIRPQDEFQPASYVPQISTTAVAEDYEELGMQLDLLSVPSQSQAERIAQMRLREVRRQATANLTSGLITSASRSAIGSRGIARAKAGTSDGRPQVPHRQQGRRRDQRRRVTLDLVETNANVYSWTTADEGDHGHGRRADPGRVADHAAAGVHRAGDYAHRRRWQSGAGAKVRVDADHRPDRRHGCDRMAQGRHDRRHSTQRPFGR